jgi:hypothetical protein
MDANYRKSTPMVLGSDGNLFAAVEGAFPN